MPVSKNRQFAKIANDVNTSGTLTAAAISSDVTLGGATIYASRSNLPSSGNTAGDQAYVTGNNRLYIWNGSGWYNIALLNLAPSIQSVLDSDGGTTPFSLSNAGAVTTITITAADSDGDPITYSATADSDFGGLANISQVDNVFTITPFSQDSASTESGTITFTATDGINVASSGVQTFRLYFISQYWDETILSIGTSSTNSLDNSTFIDRSTNAHTVTTAGSPVQTAFHPYLDNWSNYFNDERLDIANDTGFDFSSSADFTVEMWVNRTGTSGQYAGWLVGKRATGSPYPFSWYALINSNNKFAFADNATGINSTTTIETNQWYHVAVTMSSGTLRLFVNGTLENTSNSFNIGEVNAPLTIANYSVDTPQYVGYISNLRIVKGTALYTSSFTPPTEKLTAVSGTSLLTCQSNRFIDNSGNGHSITVAGTPEVSALNPFGQGSEYAVGENKGSATFPSTGTKLELGEDPLFAFGTGDYTVEFWYYSNPSSGGTIYGTVFDTSTGAAYLGSLFITASPTAGQTLIVYQNGGTRASGTTSGKNLQAGEWTHCAVTRESGTINIWINGVLDGTGSGTDDLTLSDATIGGTTYWAGAYDMRDGDIISDLKVTKGTAVYTSTFTPPTSPVGNTNASLYLPMDNAGIYDKTGNNTLILNNMGGTTTNQTKYADTSIYFDGSNDYISIPYTTPLALGTADFTIEMWVNITSTTDSYGRLIENGAYNTNDTWRINYNNTASSLIFQIGNTGTRPQIITTTALTLGSWYHIAVCRSGNTIKMFVDGTQEGGDLSYSGSLVAPTQTGEIWLGTGVSSSSSSTPANYYNGYLENVQILHGVAKYTTNFTPPTTTQGRTYQATS